MVSYDHTAENILRTAHYVPSAERGGVDQATLTAEEVLAQLEDRENSAVQMEAKSNVRLGTVYSRHLKENEMSLDQITRDNRVINIYRPNEYGDGGGVHRSRTATATSKRDRKHYNQRRINFDANSTLVTEGNKPFIANRHGEAFADSNEVEFFPKSFPCLFPWGTGGPKNSHCQQKTKRQSMWYRF
jgi:hypothetical protein